VAQLQQPPSFSPMSMHQWWSSSVAAATTWCHNKSSDDTRHKCRLTDLMRGRRHTMADVIRGRRHTMADMIRGRRRAEAMADTQCSGWLEGEEEDGRKKTHYVLWWWKTKTKCRENGEEEVPLAQGRRLSAVYFWFRVFLP